MKKLFILAAVLLAVLISVVPVFAESAEDTTTEVITEAATETTAEVTTESLTTTTEETTATPVDMDELYQAEDDRNWLIEVIKNAKPEEVAFVRGYIEDALVAMEGLNYTDWEWVYKIVSDHAEWIACMVVGIGFVVAAVVAIIKFRREKALINNSVEAVGISEREMKKMIDTVATYDRTLNALSTDIQSALVRLSERDEDLKKAAETIAKRDSESIAATKSDVEAMLLLSDVIDELIQLSNIPQIKKDAIYSKHETAKAAIRKEAEGVKDEKPEN